MEPRTLSNYMGGRWHTPAGATADVRNPATGELLARVPMSSASDVNEVVAAASRAFDGWRRTPPTERIQYLFALQAMLDEHFEEIARTSPRSAARRSAKRAGELRRGIENVEVASGIPSLMQGYNVEDIASGIDEIMIRQPLGVVARDHAVQLPRR